MEHDLGGDAVAVEVAEPGVHVEVTRCLEVVEADTPVGPHVVAAERDPFTRLRRGLPLLPQPARVAVEVVEQLLRAVRAEILGEARPDVRVARHDHERRRVLCALGFAVVCDGHRPRPSLLWEKRQWTVNFKLTVVGTCNHHRRLGHRGRSGHGTGRGVSVGPSSSGSRSATVATSHGPSFFMTLSHDRPPRCATS